MGNWCNTRLGWDFLKLHGGKEVITSPPTYGIHEEEINRSDFWATCKVKAHVSVFWTTTGWDWPSTPPEIEEICSLYSAGRIRMIMYLKDFPTMQGESSGTHKLFSMAKARLTELLTLPVLINRSGAEIARRAGTSLPLVSTADRRNVFTTEEIEGIRRAEGIFHQLNFTEYSYPEYRVPI